MKRFLACVAVGIVLVGAAVPAVAVVPGLVTIQASSRRDFSDQHQAWVACPEGKQVVGGGYAVSGLASGGDLVVSSLWPGWPGGVYPQMFAYAEESDPFAGSWEVSVIALCAGPLPGLEFVQDSSPVNSDDIKGAVATCPKGKQLVGTGFSILNGKGQVIVDDLIPNGDEKTAPTSVHLHAFEEGIFDGSDYTGNWRVTVYAICANPLPGLVRVSKSAGWSSPFSKTVTVLCPAGKALLGTGFELRASNGRVGVSELAPDIDSLGAHKLFVRGTEEDPLDIDWNLDGYAICADK